MSMVRIKYILYTMQQSYTYTYAFCPKGTDASAAVLFATVTDAAAAAAIAVVVIDVLHRVHSTHSGAHTHTLCVLTLYHFQAHTIKNAINALLLMIRRQHCH